MQTKQAEKIISTLVSDKNLVDYIQSKVVSRARNCKVHSREFVRAVDACIEEAFEELNIVQLVVDHYAERNRRKKTASPQNDIPELTFSEQEPHRVPHHRRKPNKQLTSTDGIDLNKTRIFSQEDFSHTQLLSTETSLHESSESTVEFNRIPKEVQLSHPDDASFPLNESPLRTDVIDRSDVSSHRSDIIGEDEVLNGYLGDDNHHDEADEDPWNEHVSALHEQRRHTYAPHSDPFIDDYYNQERDAEHHIDQLSQQQQQDQIQRHDIYPQSSSSQQFDDNSHEVEQAEDEYISDFHAPASDDELHSNRRVRFPDENVVSELIYSRFKYTPAEVAELFYSADEAYYFQMSYEREAQKAADAEQDWNDWIMDRINSGHHSDDDGFEDWEPAASEEDFEF